MSRPSKNNAPAGSARAPTHAVQWKGRGLYLGRKLLATVVPDRDWPGLWHVSLPNGHVTDMVNLSRAKDAAIALTCA
jgi:hypothetical protein